jgi:RNA polymerase sigma-70 factor (ECF subfamily)
VQAAPPGVTAEFLGCIGVLEAHFDYVYHALRRHGVSPVDAEDLVQEVFLVMWRRWAEYDPKRPLRPWLAGIAFRVAYNHRQRSLREVPGGLLDAEDSAPSPEDRLDSVSARALVLRVLAALPEKQRSLIVTHDLEGVPMREIADTLNIPLFTAHTRLRAARQAFAKALRRLQTVTAARSMLGPELLRDRPLPGAPAEARRRSLSRARALMAGPLPPQGGFDRRPIPSAPRPVTAALGVAAAAVAGLLVMVLRPPPPSTATRRQAASHQAASAVAPRPQVTALGKGLIGYWRFDDGPGSTIARDSSGKGNDCRLRSLHPSTDWTDGPLGGAISFDGNGWLECPHVQPLAALDREMTIAVWIKRTGSRGHVRAMVTRQAGTGMLDHFHFGFRDDELVMRSRVPGLATYAPFGAPRGSWIHVAATHAPDGTARLYIDGVEAHRAVSDRQPLGGGVNPLIIGGGANTSDPSHVKENLEGAMDELVIYDRALSGAEIAALAQKVQPPVGKP